MKYKWDISTNLSFIEFTLKYYEIGRIKGYFKKFTGEIYAEKGFDAPEINLLLEANSVSTLNKEWDSRIISKNILWADRFPLVTFRAADGCRLSTGGVQELKGDLQIRDAVNEINFVVTLSDVKKLRKEYSAHFCLTASFHLSDYGFAVEDGFIGDEASLNVNLVLVSPVT